MDANKIVETPTTERNTFRNELEILINSHSRENPSGTPDFILADYMVGCLNAFDKAIERRTNWLNG